MASPAPLGRERAIQLVAEGALPVTLGPVVVVHQDGKFRIRERVVDVPGAEAAAAAATRARSPSWMPAHYYALGKPTGKVHVEAASRAELVALMRTMAWPAEW